MTNEYNDEAIANAINAITEKVSAVMLKEFLTLPDNLQMNYVLIKSAQLLLANVLCQVVSTKGELEDVINRQATEVKELTLDCAFTGFADKFCMRKH